MKNILYTLIGIIVVVGVVIPAFKAFAEKQGFVDCTTESELIQTHKEHMQNTGFQYSDSFVEFCKTNHQIDLTI